MKLTVVIEPEVTGGFSAYCPSFPGCFSAGNTLEEAKTNIREAVECHIESLKKDGTSFQPSEAEPLIAQIDIAV